MSTFAWVIGLAAAVCTTAANYRSSRRRGPPVRRTTSLLRCSCCSRAAWRCGSVLRAAKGHHHCSSERRRPGAARCTHVLEATANSLLSAPAGSGNETSLRRRLVGRIGCSVSARQAPRETTTIPCATRRGRPCPSHRPRENPDPGRRQASSRLWPGQPRNSRRSDFRGVTRTDASTRRGGRA